MWFEIIPSCAIISVALFLPGFATYHINKAVIGNAFRRNTDLGWDRSMYRRDWRLTGSAYNQNGLESIPDKKD